MANGTGSNLGFEERLWTAADKLRGTMDASEYKHVALGDAESRSKDILGRVYEYFLGKFASSEGKGGAEFYTPQAVVRLLFEKLKPFNRRVFNVITPRLIQFYFFTNGRFQGGAIPPEEVQSRRTRNSRNLNLRQAA